MLGCRCWTVVWFAIVLLWWIWRQKSGGSGGCHVAAWSLPCQWLLLVVRVFNRLKEVILNLFVSIKSERQNLPINKGTPDLCRPVSPTIIRIAPIEGAAFQKACLVMDAVGMSRVLTKD